jgi:hypothetical protein
MDSFVLISTLTASMSFGAVLGFQPAATAAMLATLNSAFQRIVYQTMCAIIPILAGFSTIFGLYATITFSLTILYGKSMCQISKSRCTRIGNIMGILTACILFCLQALWERNVTWNTKSF